MENGLEALAPCFAAADVKHRGRGVDPFDVEPIAQERDQQPPRAAGDLQCRSAGFGDLPLKECLVLVRLVAEPQIVALRREAADSQSDGCMNADATEPWRSTP